MLGFTSVLVKYGLEPSFFVSKSILESLYLSTSLMGQTRYTNQWVPEGHIHVRYHYALRQESKQLAKERIKIQKRRDSTIEVSASLHRARSDTSYTNNKRHRHHGSRFENLEYSERQSISKNLDSSFLSIDEQGNIIPKTPEAALMAAQAHLHRTRPSPGDPREHMHRAALQGLKMVGSKLSAKEEEAHRNKLMHKPRSPCRHSSPRHRSGS
jgi:hypothetical protein